jgi:UDP-N-acetylglucosamine acyltransferase
LARIHPTAVVETGAKLAEDVEIGAHAYVGPEVELAAGVVLRPHAMVTGRTTIGEKSRVFPYAVLGEEPQDHSFSGESTELVVGKGTTIREHAVIHVGTRKGGGLLAVEAGCTLLLQREALVREADAAGIALLGVDGRRVPGGRP